jgi:hypothetical protein
MIIGRCAPRKALKRIKKEMKTQEMKERIAYLSRIGGWRRRWRWLCVSIRVIRRFNFIVDVHSTATTTVVVVVIVGCIIMVIITIILIIFIILTVVVDVGGC